MWVLPTQLAVAEALPADDRGAAAVVVIAGSAFFFFFLATAGEATPRASSAASAAAAATVKRLPIRAFSLPDMPAILPPAVPPNPAIESANPGGQRPGPRRGGGSRMNAGRSRLALIGVLALAVCLAVGLAAGAAEAKKGKKKGAPITVSKIAPTAIPAGDANNGVAGVAAVPLTVGKKAKGKVVSSLSVTYQLTDPAAQLDDIDLKVTAPGGRTVFLDNPTLFFGDGDTVTTVGPLTESPDSSTGFCFPNPTPPPA